MKLASLLRRFASVAFLAGCTASFTGIKGDGTIQTENRAISDFTAVEVSGVGDVQWSSGAPSLTITTDQNLLPHIRSEVAGGTLKIHPEGSLEPTHGIKIVIAGKALVQANLTGAVNLTARQVSSASFAVISSGASTTNVDGNVANLTAELTGACRLNAPLLSTKSADVTLTGASVAEVAVKEVLKATITGAGSLTYSGQPTTIEKQITGAGSLHHK